MALIDNHLFSKKSFSPSYLLSILLFALLLSSSPLSAQKPLGLFYFDPMEGGSFRENITTKFESYMAEQHCPIKVITKIANGKPLLSFTAKPLDKDVFTEQRILTRIKTYKNLPVTSAILVHASTGITDLKSLEDSRFGIISPSSYIGQKIPQQMFTQADSNINATKIYITGNHQSAIGLLLHNNIFSTVLAGPLAHRWAKTNNLTIVSESQPLDIGKVLINKSAKDTVIENCRKALLELKRTTPRDKRIYVFPAWVDGFKI